MRPDQVSLSQREAGAAVFDGGGVADAVAGSGRGLKDVRRLSVVGSPGSGKSSTAARLGLLLGLPVYHMDDLFWNPGWVPTPDEEFHQVIHRITDEDRWIMDGSYSRFRRPVFHRAEFAVWLDLTEEVKGMVHVRLRSPRAAAWWMKEVESLASAGGENLRSG